MGKDGFVIYKSFFKPISKLSDEQLGKLFRAIFQYQLGEAFTIGEDIEMAFEFFKNQFELDESKYQCTVERNRENGRRGGNPNFKKGSPNPYYTRDCKEITEDNPEITEDNPTLPKITEDKHKDKDKDKEKDKEKDKKENMTKENAFSEYPAEWMEVFDEWLAYKADRKESYKSTMSLKAMAKKLYNLAHGDVDMARRIIEQSIANNWQGLFALREESESNTASVHPGDGLDVHPWERPTQGESFDDWKRRLRSRVDSVRLSQLIKMLW
jgi:hypothetical protein